MRIKNLTVNNFRNIESISFEASDSVNFISGPNGAGKSSILEAINLLSSGRSFRTHIINELIKKHTAELFIHSEFKGAVAGQHTAGLQKSTNGDLHLRLDQQSLKSTAELARVYPVRTIHPDMHELIRGGPSIRRKFVDWGVFHVEQQFHIYWKRYNYALRQRNQLLKSKQVSRKEVEAWSVELYHSGSRIDQLRRFYLDELAEPFQRWIDHFEINGKISFVYKKGWDKEVKLDIALENSIANCLKYRTTTVGPHRADLGMTFDGYTAKQVISRGQQKLLIYALVFAQIDLHQSKVSETPVLLCDDPEAELDFKHRTLFLKAVRDSGIQTFITGSEEKTWSALDDEKNLHIKNGSLFNTL